MKIKHLMTKDPTCCVPSDTAQRAAKMKSILMDQKFISGLGNIYSDEVLFTAGLRFDRLSQRAAKIMREEDTGVVPIIEHEHSRKVIGIVTDRDLCMNVVA